MAKAKTINKPRHKKRLVFKNVAVLAEDHERLRRIADQERRSMAQQLTVLIRRAEEQSGLPAGGALSGSGLG